MILRYAIKPCVSQLSKQQDEVLTEHCFQFCYQSLNEDGNVTAWQGAILRFGENDEDVWSPYELCTFYPVMHRTSNGSRQGSYQVFYEIVGHMATTELLRSRKV